MSLGIGTRLGPYEILSLLGAGGMGEVYRAHDSKLDREVAIKILPDALAADPDRIARFEREAKALASLNHPNIAHLYGFEKWNGTSGLVMELVEGETLSTRLERGALPLNQALTSAIQIAEALGAAHRKGIVHRDLKPGNVMLTRAGVKLLDFGLAKLGQAGTVTSPVSMLPTTSAVQAPETPLTVQGTILGTVQYMAPEQLDGRDADTRTDIFAFGEILYELVTGTKAFNGRSQASVIGAIMHAEPQPMIVGQPLTPPALERLVRACLAKDPDDRWQSAHDVARELKQIATASPDPSPIPVRSRVLTPMVVAALVLAAGAIGAGASFVWWRGSSSPDPDVVRFTIAPPSVAGGGAFSTSPGTGPGTMVPPLSISPDGRSIVFGAANSDGRPILWLRPLDRDEARPLPGTEGGRYPFWSTDSRTIAFLTQGDLKMIDVAGGRAKKIRDVDAGAGGTINSDGTVLLGSLLGDMNRGIWRTALDGRQPTPVTLQGIDGASEVRSPSFLPDGRHFLYWNRSHRAIYVASLDTGKVERIVDSDAAGQYASGHLLFVRGQTLITQPFDLSNFKLSRQAQSLGEVAVTTTGYAAVSASNTGTLVMTSGSRQLSQLTWMDRSGNRQGDIGSSGSQGAISLGPSDQRVLLARTDDDGSSPSVWLFDVTRENARMRIGEGSDPRLSRDGAFALYSLPLGRGIGRIRLSGGGAEVLLNRSAFVTDTSLDGRTIVLQLVEPGRQFDVELMDVATKQIRPLVATAANEGRARYSPDEQWLAYVSDDSKRPEVYVCSVAEPERRIPISTNGGMQPKWRRDGRELYYLAGDLVTIMAVEIQLTGTELTAGPPKALFKLNGEATSTPSGFFGSDFEPSATGNRFLVNQYLGQLGGVLNVIVNWPPRLSE
jgi:serine/threonine protein kinase